jgi:hypothetical protein
LKTTIVHEFDLGEIVHLKMARERRPGMVTQLHLDRSGLAYYVVSWGDATDSRHYEMELAREYVPDFESD